MKSRLGKRNFSKSSQSKNGSGALLDEFDNFDIQERNELIDDQYDDLIQDTGNYRKSIAAHDFDEDPKYKGIKVSKDALYDEDIDDEEIISSEDELDEEEKEEPKPKRKNKVSLNDLNIDKLLKDIDEEDQEIVSSKKDKLKEKKKAIAVKHQQALFDMLIESRVKMQDMLKLANRFPYSQTFPLIQKTDTSKEVNKSLKELEIEVVDLIDMLNGISHDYHNKAKSDCALSNNAILQKSQQYLRANNIKSKTFLDSYDFDMEQIWKTLDENFEKQSPYIDNVVSNWAQKFNIMNQSSMKGKFANIFQTPSQQTNKAMEDFDRLVKRTQLRDLSARPLFESTESSTNYDEEIYNDEEFYITIFREMLQKQAQNEAQNNESGEFLVENTRLYLKNRQLRSKPKKDVDRRASKNRKLRFDVHSKLMNFMAPIDNISLLPGRDQLLKNLFGLYQKIDEKTENKDKTANSSLKKKRKKNPELENEVEINLL